MRWLLVGVLALAPACQVSADDNSAAPVDAVTAEPSADGASTEQATDTADSHTADTDTGDSDTGDGDTGGTAAVEGQPATVDRIVDGDTVILDIDGQRERVRLIGIDTPESVAENRPRQCYGDEASDAIAGLLPEGSAVVAQRDIEARDQYDRLLLYIYRADDGLFVNRWMVENGFAAAVVYEPNSAHYDEFRALEAAAAQDGVGLWGVCDGPDQPLDPDEG